MSVEIYPNKLFYLPSPSLSANFPLIGFSSQTEEQQVGGASVLIAKAVPRVNISGTVVLAHTFETLAMLNMSIHHFL